MKRRLCSTFSDTVFIPPVCKAHLGEAPLHENPLSIKRPHIPRAEDDPGKEAVAVLLQESVAGSRQLRIERGVIRAVLGPTSEPILR